MCISNAVTSQYSSPETFSTDQSFDNQASQANSASQAYPIAQSAESQYFDQSPSQYLNSNSMEGVPMDYYDPSCVYVQEPCVSYTPETQVSESIPADDFGGIECVPVSQDTGANQTIDNTGDTTGLPTDEPGYDGLDTSCPVSGTEVIQTVPTDDAGGIVCVPPTQGGDSTQPTDNGGDNTGIDTWDDGSIGIDNSDQDGVSVVDGTTVNQTGDNNDNGGFDGWTGGVGNGNVWKDADGDGDADMTLVIGQGLDRQAVEQAAKQLEDGSGGKLDIHIVDQAPTDGSEYGTITAEELGGNLAGLSTVGSGADVQIDTQSSSSVGIITHELMHAAGVTEDGSANGGDSIMDYSYMGSTLTSYDKGLLENLYGNMTAGTNT